MNTVRLNNDFDNCYNAQIGPWRVLGTFSTHAFSDV